MIRLHPLNTHGEFTAEILVLGAAVHEIQGGRASGENHARSAHDGQTWAARRDGIEGNRLIAAVPKEQETRFRATRMDGSQVEDPRFHNEKGIASPRRFGWKIGGGESEEEGQPTAENTSSAATPWSRRGPLGSARWQRVGRVESRLAMSTILRRRIAWVPGRRAVISNGNHLLLHASFPECQAEKRPGSHQDFPAAFVTSRAATFVAAIRLDVEA